MKLQARSSQVEQGKKINISGPILIGDLSLIMSHFPPGLGSEVMGKVWDKRKELDHFLISFDMVRGIYWRAKDQVYEVINKKTKKRLTLLPRSNNLVMFNYNRLKDKGFMDPKESTCVRLEKIGNEKIRRWFMYSNGKIISNYDLVIRPTNKMF